VATGGTGGVYFPYGGAIAAVIGARVPGVEATAEVTGGSVDNLKLIARGRADLGFTLADTAADAASGVGQFADFGVVPARALAVLYTNYTQVAAFAGAGIARLADLKGRVVSTGAAGSGTELIAVRVLAAAGLDAERDLTRRAMSASASVDALRDGTIDALFFSSGVPTAALLDLARTPGKSMALVPHAEVLPELARRHGPLYVEAVVPKGAYGLPADVPVVGVQNLLAVDARMREELAHDITRALFEGRDALVAVHPEARHLALPSAVRGSPIPFHDGAIRFYRERGAWP
jgi:TRAP transporter TAXI family solute receptor